MKNKIREDAERVVEVLTKHSNQRVYTFGNGGSAAIADHMACDWMKLTEGRLKVISLSSNGPLLSAIGNDLGYEETCAAQLRWLLRKTDILVLVSSSGQSQNILRAANYANELDCTVIGFSGVAGKPKLDDHLLNLCEVSVHLDSEDYGEIEDYHSQVMHEVARQLVAK